MTDELAGVGQGLGEETAEAPSSIEDDVKKVYDELYGKADTELKEEGEAVDDEPTKGGDESTPEAATEGEGDSPEESDDDIDPPSDWSAEAKEWFRACKDRDAKKEHRRIADEFQRWRKKQITEIRTTQIQLDEDKSQVSDCVKVVSKWLPRWGVNGATPEKAITQLCAFNELVITDTAAAIEQLAKSAGLKIQIEGRTNKKSENSTHVPLVDVENHVNTVLEARLQQASHQQRAQSVVSEVNQALEGLSNEVNELGKYVYPDFHNLEFQRNEIEPLAQGIWRANPNLSAKDVLLRAYRAANGRVLPKQNPATARLNGARKTELAKRAASSISGSFGRSQEDVEFVPGESVEETTARIYARLTGR
jgi:hypothetical protein